MSILVNAPSRTLRQLYGDPPAGLSPTCTPGRGENTVGEWYAAQEEMYGRYAALKAQRPKSLGWFGRKSEAEQETQYLEVVDNSQSVQDKLKKMRMLPGGHTEAQTEDGIHWFTIDSEVIDA